MTTRMKCKSCESEILETTYKSNQGHCYKCKEKETPLDKQAEFVVHTIFGGAAAVVAYFNFNIIIAALAFIVFFHVGKLYTYICKKYKLNEEE